MLLLPEEEEGHAQGLIHTEGRVVKFRLQFAQKCPTGSKDLVWIDVTSCIIGRTTGLQEDTYTDLNRSEVLKDCMDSFLFISHRLNVKDYTAPGLTNLHSTTEAVTLRKIVAGPGLKIQQLWLLFLGGGLFNILNRWTKMLNKEEAEMLQEYSEGV